MNSSHCCHSLDGNEEREEEWRGKIHINYSGGSQVSKIPSELSESVF